MSDLLNAFFSQSHYANLDQGGSSSGGSGSGSSTNTRLQQQQLYIQNYLMNLGSNELENTESKAFKKMLYQLMIQYVINQLIFDRSPFLFHFCFLLANHVQQQINRSINEHFVDVNRLFFIFSLNDFCVFVLLFVFLSVCQ